MSRAKSRQNMDVCGDCGASDPTWASINRGILLCIQCCHTHRSLGRHISIVKSIQKSIWDLSQLQMVYALNNGGANSIWEHALENGSKLSKRKPSPNDTLEEKAKFIRSKHQSSEFLFRPNIEDGLLCIENELGKQLHASVRSNNLMTSFRLLIQGADPNYFHDEKGSTPLHAASKANQLLQAELLLIYGADPTYPDAGGKTPIDYARQNVNKSLANRLVECQYEVTDKFSNYLCLRKPDHQNGIDFLLPPTGPRSNPTSMEKLKRLNNQLFEELVKDVYDEVDRREIEAIWLGSADTIELSAVPFLPVDPTLSTTRNQSRQKLGRFASPELKALVYDILVDSQRRQKLCEKGQPRQLSQISDDDPLYDSVASDDDYAVVPPISEEECGSSKSSTPKSTDQNQNSVSLSSSHDKQQFETLKQELLDSSGTINELKCEISNLKALVEHLSSINHDLRSRLSHVENNSMNGNNQSFNSDSGAQSLDGYLLSRSEESNQPQSLTNGSSAENNNSDTDAKYKKVQRPSSMYETREGLRTVNWQTLKNQLKQNEQNNRTTTQSMYSPTIPQSQSVMQCTEQVTKGIAELWRCIQGSGRENCIPCADKIRYAVTNLAAAIPMENGTEIVKHLLESVSHLQTNCLGLQNACKAGDTFKSDMYIQKVRTSAYEIAKDTKLLVTKYNSHSQ